MLKILVLLLLVYHVVSVEYFLSRVLVLVNENARMNTRLRIDKDTRMPVAKIANNNDNSDSASCTCPAKKKEVLLMKSKVDEYFYGQFLIINWVKALKFYQRGEMQGQFSIKYQDDKYPSVKETFNLCNDGKKSLGKEIFYEVFVKEYSFYECIDVKRLSFGNAYFWDGPTYNSIHCNTNATIRIDLFETVDADCGVGGSGESNEYNTFRVIFNTMFENCDGKKYDIFGSLPKSTLNLLKLATADEMGKELANYPIL